VGAVAVQCKAVCRPQPVCKRTDNARATLLVGISALMASGGGGREDNYMHSYTIELSTEFCALAVLLLRTRSTIHTILVTKR
jgi:hypothetical protein